MNTAFRIPLTWAAVIAAAVACEQSFPEWHRGKNFSVVVKMAANPVPRIRVLLTPDNERNKLDIVETTSDRNGVAHFSAVKPGNYYVEALRLGITVGPGKVIVSDRGSAEQIEVQWPLRPTFSVVSAAGRFQRHFYPKERPIEGFAHPQVGPLAAAKLTLSRVDSEKQIAIVTTDLGGNFDFHAVDPGAYLLHIEEKRSAEFWQPIDDYLLVQVDPSAPLGYLNLQVDWTSCGIIATEL